MLYHDKSAQSLYALQLWACCTVISFSLVLPLMVKLFKVDQTTLTIHGDYISGSKIKEIKKGGCDAPNIGIISCTSSIHQMLMLTLRHAMAAHYIDMVHNALSRRAHIFVGQWPYPCYYSPNMFLLETYTRNLVSHLWHHFCLF